MYDLQAVSAGGSHTIGLHKDGTLVAFGDNRDNQLNIAGWRDIVDYNDVLIAYYKAGRRQRLLCQLGLFSHDVDRGTIGIRLARDRVSN